MNIQLSDHFTYQKLLRFTAPSIIMMVFISIYNIVDGFFVSNFIGSSAFAAVDIVFPFLMIIGAFGFMIGTGGSALVAKTLGEKSHEKANAIFSLIVYSTIVLGVFLSVCGMLLLEPFLKFLGVEPHLEQNCLGYGYIIIGATPFFMLQVLFHSFFITAEKPKLGLFITVFSGSANALMDVIFIVLFGWGLEGCALATAISQTFAGIISVMYFVFPNKSPLRLGKTNVNLKVLLKTYTNGLSEFVSHLSMSVLGTVYNYQLLRMLGENGVVSYGIICNINFIFIASFLGFNSGSAPIISYHYGAKNYSELQNLFKKCITLIAGAGCFLFLCAELLAPVFARIFVKDDQILLDIAIHALRIYSVAFLLVGFNIFASSFFTALNNGIVSAIISILRIFVFECLCVLLLPIILGVNGIWCAIIVAQILSLLVSGHYLLTRAPKYKYM